ncbi:hypothetical protein V5O48_015750, partial [Marasmius crinis-equi]
MYLFYRTPRLSFLALATALLFTLAHARASNILTALSQMDDCDSCRDLLVELKSLAVQGDDVFIVNFIELCDGLRAEDPDVCNGTVTRSGPIIAHDLRQIDVTSGKASAGLCDALFGFCSTNASTPFQVPLPAPSTGQRSKSTSEGRPRKEPFQVVHISDVHIDRGYTVGSEGNCTKPLCCRNFADQAGAPISDPAKPNGNSKCDTPVSLADSFLDAVDAFNPRFVIFTGDVVEGMTWLEDQANVENDLEDFNAELLTRLRAPVFPAIGNHDSAPVNAFARTTSMTANDSQFVFDVQSDGWTVWIGDTAGEQVKHHSGSYSSLVPGTDLRYLIHTSIGYELIFKWFQDPVNKHPVLVQAKVCSSDSICMQAVMTVSSFWLYDSDEFQPDPNGLLAFIVEQLQAAEEAGEKVWVIGHIPLGKEDLVEDQSNYYNQILQRYKETIAGHFFGHSHKDQFEIAYTDYDNQIASNAVSVASIGPALTPTSGNPAFKVYDVDPDTFGLMNIRVIFSNFSDPSFQTQPTWTELYNTRDLYGPLVNPPLPSSSELTPAFWHNLTETFQANDTAFQLFNALLSREGAITPCDAQCKETTICDMRAFRSENNCDTPTPGVSLRRRDGERAMRLETEA